VCPVGSRCKTLFHSSYKYTQLSCIFPKKLKGIGSEGRRTCSSLLPHIQMSNKKLKDGDDSAYRKVGLLLEIKMDK
jgi:hypothetical protein